MALKLENEFLVAAPLEPTWQTLLDLERVAGCLPGATIEPADEEGRYAGSMRVKLGPVSMSYKGTARLDHVDEATRACAKGLRSTYAWSIPGRSKSSTNVAVPRSSGSSSFRGADQPMGPFCTLSGGPVGGRRTT